MNAPANRVASARAGVADATTDATVTAAGIANQRKREAWGRAGYLFSWDGN